jgi:hypothetical protein
MVFLSTLLIQDHLRLPHDGSYDGGDGASQTPLTLQGLLSSIQITYLKTFALLHGLLEFHT